MSLNRLLHGIRELEQLKADNAKMRQALTDIAQAQPIWHGGVGRVPYDQLQTLVGDLRDIATEALRT